jgi:hypothetical protein
MSKETGWNVPRIWEKGRCLVIGGGPSMPFQFDIPLEVISMVRDKTNPLSVKDYSPFMSCIHSEHVIVVNNGYLLGDWPDICFFGDYGWYKSHCLNLANWTGIKVTCSPAFSDQTKAKAEGIKYLRRDPDRRLGLSENPHRVAWGFNSGSSAINLAIHLGCKQVILLGFDMNYGPAGESHWHQGHGNDNRPRANYARFMQGFPIMAKDAKRIGVEIINCSPGTAIKDFPIAKLKEVLK